MQPLFLDTGALYAFYDPDDGHHHDAVRILSGAQAARRPLVTSTDVFVELVTLLSRRAHADTVIRIGDDLRREQNIRLVRVDDEIRDRAWTICKARRLPRLSFADCTSSAIMTLHRIREVFTFDEDFRRLGHRTLPPLRPLLKPRAPTAPPRRGRRARKPLPSG